MGIITTGSPGVPMLFTAVNIAAGALNTTIKTL
jgi:hypothetical protein